MFRNAIYKIFLSASMHLHTSFGRKDMRIFQKIAMEVGTVRRGVFDEIRAKVSGCTYLNFTD